MKRSVIFPGGGMRVAYQAGVFRALSEAGLEFFHGDGSSGGIMNLAMHLSGLSAPEMCERWQTLNVHDFASLEKFDELVLGPESIALSSSDGVRNKVYPHLGIDAAKIRACTATAGSFNVCDFANKTLVTVPHTEVTLDHLVAGISLPIFMPPVMIGGQAYTDSVWIKDANLIEAVRRGAEEIWVIWAVGNTAEYAHGWFRQYVHMIEMAANGSLIADLAAIAGVNGEIAAGRSPYGQTGPIRVHLVHPEFPLPLDPDYFLGRIDGPTLVAMGYADGCRYLANQPADGIALTSDATRMQEPGEGLTFREKMSGSFFYGATDPQAPPPAGAAARPIVLHATIQIDDAESFLTDPEHPGRLVGSVESPEWGNAPIVAGEFNLFVPDPGTTWRLMVYTARFNVNGQMRYFAGRKIAGRSSVLGVWHETTTLYTTLHDGSDDSAPIIGAGVLSLGVSDLVAMLETMHATWASHPIAVLERFGKVFLGGLWESYFHHITR